MKERPRYLAISVATMLASAVLAAPAAAAGGAERALAVLDYERAADGIPAGLTLNSTWSADCAAHDRYMALHGLSHTETPGAKGYSAGGAYAAAGAVLAAGAGWSAGNPYLDAPLHLDQLLAPQLASFGSADAHGYSCTTTFPGWTRPAPASLTLYADPGNGRRGVARSEVADESPFTPVQLAGLPPGARTGPVLTVFAAARGAAAEDDPATLSGATLSGPGGPVEVRTVDGTSTVPGGGTLAAYIAPGGFIIPVAPLAAGTTYHAHVVIGFARSVTSLDWSFTTTGTDPRSSLVLDGSALGFHSASRAPARVTFHRVGGGSAPALKIAPGRSATLHLAAGTWEACATQAASGDYTAYAGCIALTVTGTPVLRFGRPAATRSTVTFPLRSSSVLHGRRGSLNVTVLRGSRVLRHRSATVRIGRSVSEPLPPRGDTLELTIDVPAFSAHAAPYAASSATAEWTRR